jgi:hypothetical protein
MYITNQDLKADTTLLCYGLRSDIVLQEKKRGVELEDGLSILVVAN